MDAEPDSSGAFGHGETPSPHSQQAISGGASKRTILVSPIARDSCPGQQSTLQPVRLPGRQTYWQGGDAKPRQAIDARGGSITACLCVSGMGCGAYRTRTNCAGRLVEHQRRTGFLVASSRVGCRTAEDARHSQVKRTVLALIRFYQRKVSRVLPPSCRFVPSCSNYAYEAIDRYGLWKGGWIALRRLGRCHPFNPGGYDPVP